MMAQRGYCADMARPNVVREPHCAGCACTVLVLEAGGRKFIATRPLCAGGLAEAEEGLRAVLDAADAAEREVWAGGLRQMAALLDTGDTFGPAFRSTLAAELREAAAAPPDCEVGFRFCLCLLMEWHPKRNKDDLDRAVAFARKGAGR